jgi:hypothetical protein
MRVVRWILLPIVCIAAWIAALFTGIVAHSAAELFCPADQMVSGMWTAVVSWAWGEFIAAGVGGVAAVLLLTRGKGIFRRTSRAAPQNA